MRRGSHDPTRPRRSIGITCRGPRTAPTLHLPDTRAHRPGAIRRRFSLRSSRLPRPVTSGPSALHVSAVPSRTTRWWRAPTPTPLRRRGAPLRRS